MRQKIFFTFILILFLFSCGGFDKDLISKTEKLISPNGKLTLYRYFVDTPMSFGSGFTVINILDSDEECDYTDHDIFRFGNDYPIIIKWKDNKTLNVKCLMNGGGLRKQQPVKKEIKHWKDYTFEVEYYTMFSTGGGSDFVFDKYTFSSDDITFKSKTDSLVISKANMQFSLDLDSNRIYMKGFKIDWFRSQVGVSLLNYELSSKRMYNHKDFIKEQPFIRTKF